MDLEVQILLALKFGLLLFVCVICIHILLDEEPPRPEYLELASYIYGLLLAIMILPRQ
jgi:hypothetical protein